MLTDLLAPYKELRTIVNETIRIWPAHAGYCENRFKSDRSDFLSRTNDVARLILKNIGAELPKYVEDYQWMCLRFLEEEIHFQREKEYRLSTFADAYREVYSDLDFMGRYMRGLLISQILWDPHARAIDIFRTDFLPKLSQGVSYLEVGPGHGLFLYFASQAKQIALLEAWDVSKASIVETRAALSRLGVTPAIRIIEQDVLQAPSRRNEFDGAVISEVLEHLERPDKALKSLHAALKPGGQIFINAPINSPAPDHIYLWRSTGDLTRFVEEQGFEIESSHFLPVTGYSLPRAVKSNVSISCVVIARRV